MFVYVALRAGGRRGELLGLMWADVDLEGRSVLFTHTKGKRDRRVPVSGDVADVLRQLKVQTL